MARAFTPRPVWASACAGSRSSISTTGDQPVANESGTVKVVFNGEIYNYRELRAELIAKGHTFKSSGDSEVIPHLYDEYGLDFIGRLNGMFAIALWDAPRRRLLLTRDRVGIKPLYYSLHQGNLYFGSEVKCILAAGGSTREIDPARHRSVADARVHREPDHAVQGRSQAAARRLAHLDRR